MENAEDVILLLALIFRGCLDSITGNYLCGPHHKEGPPQERMSMYLVLLLVLLWNIGLVHITWPYHTS